MMKVSIITPSFNQGRFIEQTISSVLGQAGDFELEYIVVDGLSIDNSVEIINRYYDLLAAGRYPIKCKKIIMKKIIEKDNGQTEAINKGLKIATGDYLSYLNSDDLLIIPDTIKKNLDLFANKPEIGLIYGGLEIIDENGDLINEDPAEPFVLEKMLNIKNIISQPGAFFSRAAFEKTGLFDEKLHYCMDYDYFLRIAKNFKIIMLNDFVAKFRYCTGTKTHTETNKFYSEMRKISRRSGGRFFNQLFLNHYKSVIKDFIYGKSGRE